MKFDATWRSGRALLEKSKLLEVLAVYGFRVEGLGFRIRIIDMEIG